MASSIPRSAQCSHHICSAAQTSRVVFVPGLCLQCKFYCSLPSYSTQSSTTKMSPRSPTANLVLAHGLHSWRMQLTLSSNKIQICWAVFPQSSRLWCLFFFLPFSKNSSETAWVMGDVCCAVQACCNADLSRVNLALLLSLTTRSSILFPCCSLLFSFFTATPKQFSPHHFIWRWRAALPLANSQILHESIYLSFFL